MIRYGIIGCGAWGRCYAEAIKKNPKLKLGAVVESSENALPELRRNYPDAMVFSNYREILSADLDLVAVVVPNHLHYEIGMAVLESGKHLLMEKPFAPTAEECDGMIRLAEKKNLRLAIGHQFRLSSLWGLIKKMIDDGFVGEPRYALVELSRNPYRLGVDGWRFDPRRVGNWISEEPIHFLDLACWYFDRFSHPVSIHASSNSSDGTRPDLHDNVGATIEFSDGSFAVVAQTLSAFEHHQTVKIAGTKGALWGGWSGALDRTLHPDFFLKAFDGKNVETIPIEKQTGELFELEDQLALMADVVVGNATVHCTGAEGRLAVALSLAALESSKQKQPIPL